MKTVQKTVPRGLAAALALAAAACHPARAAVPIQWTVDTSRADYHAIEQFSGTSIDLEATLMSDRGPLAVEGEPLLYWQTNGMGKLWFHAPATASNNVLRATWTPACETAGATAYKGFIGIPGSVYSAAFALRLRPSPGASPNALPLPTPRIDFASVEIANAPWPTEEAVAAALASATNALLPLAGGALSGDLSAGAGSQKVELLGGEGENGARVVVRGGYHAGRVEVVCEGRESVVISSGHRAGGPDETRAEVTVGDLRVRAALEAATNRVGEVAAGLAAKQDRPAATAAAASLALRPDGAAVSVAVAAGGELAADLSGWTDGQAQTALISLAPGATVADGVRLAGYGSWPTNRFLASCVRVGARVYVVPVAAICE